MKNSKSNGLARFLKSRDLWKFSVFKYQNIGDIFESAPLQQVLMVGESRLRLGFDYKAVCADPFLFTYGGKLYVFFEEKTDHGHGVISAYSMGEDCSWINIGPVLVEEFHLSYPQVFSVDNKIFMIPESAQSGQVRLYEAVDFPRSWRLACVLINESLRDPTIYISGESSFHIISTSAEFQRRVHFSPSLMGPYNEISRGMVGDKRFARGAGAIFEVDGKKIRPSQDCSDSYGQAIDFQVISDISSTSYSEFLSEIKMHLSVPKWMARGSHHVSSARFGDYVYLAVDGNSPDRLINSLLLAMLRLREFIAGVFLLRGSK